MTVIIECRVCHHALSSHQVGRNDKFKATYTNCQVPIRVPLPNSPNEAMMVPCGCNGTGIETPEPEIAPLPNPARCFNPGCQEFARQTSSFCSDACENEMAALISRMNQEIPNG